jgi:hypothetical protein
MGAGQTSDAQALGHEPIAFLVRTALPMLRLSDQLRHGPRWRPALGEWQGIGKARPATVEEIILVWVEVAVFSRRPTEQGRPSGRAQGARFRLGGGSFREDGGFVRRENEEGDGHLRRPSQGRGRNRPS